MGNCTRCGRGLETDEQQHYRLCEACLRGEPDRHATPANATPAPTLVQPELRAELAHLLGAAAAAMRVAEDLLQLAAVKANGASADVQGLGLALDIAFVQSEQHEITLKVQRGADALTRGQF